MEADGQFPAAPADVPCCDPRKCVAIEKLPLAV